MALWRPRLPDDHLHSADFCGGIHRYRQQAALQGSNELQVFAQKKMQELQQRAYEAVTADLETLAKKYKRDPK